MARKLRLQYPGAIYHVMSRGDHREPIFRDEQDRRIFLQTLAEAFAKTDWYIHAWCLMPNHLHLLIETPRGNSVDGMKWLLGTYTQRFNARHKLWGHLFSGRYKALLVDGSGHGYLKTVGDYIHLNPARANLLRRSQKLSEFAWSSYPEYLKPPAQRVGWLKVERMLGEHRIPKDIVAGRREFELRMESRRQAEDGAEFKPLERGWCHGSEAFRDELLAQMSEKAGPEHYGQELRESAEAKARRILGEELKQIGWPEARLSQRRKGDPQKVRIALRLRRETTMTTAWIAQQLAMGSRHHLTHLLYWHGKK